MISALDTNVLAAVMYSEPTAERISQHLQLLRLSGDLLICGPVYAELSAGPQVTPLRLDHFLNDVNVHVDWRLDEAVWRSSGAAFATYAARRRASGGGSPRRVLADFVIGAHALSRGAQLVTLDAQHYAACFPELHVVLPA
ncbi:type II toxin-antitoxin system VapC family toxin [Deinococcus aluminii]|uniref:PIN domain-containing protein n=1 Tax=Deinococcus aluminii TaxID=1656885 RepID=A0ABP9X9T4_9DEIO